MDRTIAAAFILAVLAAGCAGVSPGMSPKNLAVCQHYETQRARILALATPTLADVLDAETWIAADVAESSGRLHADFAAMLTAMQASRSPAAPSTRVYDECTAAGVKFSPPA